MVTSLTGGSAGDFWHRLGELEGCVLDMLSVLGGTATTNVASGAQLPVRLTAWFTDFFSNGTADLVTATALQQAVADMQASPLAIVSAIGQIVPEMLIIEANLITPLASLDVTTAFQFLVDKMVAASALINHGTPPAVGAQTNATWVTPTGNPAFIWSVKDSAGRVLQYTFPETVTVTITQDVDEGATAGQEQYSITGQNAQDDRLSWDWLGTKYGSGATGSGTLIDPAIDNNGDSSGNLLVNGVFNTFTTTNQADNWTYAVGVATTNFTNGTSSNAYYSGEGSLGLLSAGGTKNAVTQAFDTTSTTTVGSGGTSYPLVASAPANTQYAVFLAVKLSSGSPANGTLTVDLITGDGTVAGSTTTTDDAGTSNTFAIDLTAIADTNWHVVGGVSGLALSAGSQIFRLPKVLATGPYKIRAAFTGTILTAGVTCYINLGMAIQQQLYAGGPYFVGFRGSTSPNASGAYADAWTFAITYTIGKAQKSIWRYFNPPSMGDQTPGLIMPAVTAGSATIPDSLFA